MTDIIAQASLIEQETIIRISPGEELVYIWTNNPVHVRHFTNDERYTNGGVTPDGASFTIPRSKYNPVKGAKREVNLTDEQRAEIGKRLKGARNS